MASSDPDTDIELHELLGNNSDPRSKEHQKVLEEAKKVAHAFVISSSIGYFSEAMMLVTWILFAKSMSDCTDNAITVLVFLQAILQVVGILFTSYLSHKYGFDTITIYTSTLLLLSALLQSLSYSIIPLGIGVALKGLVMNDIEVLSLDFIAKTIPSNDASNITRNWLALSTITWLFGILIAGILSTYTALSYRLVFIIAVIITLFRWIYILIQIRNTQKTLTDKQLTFIDYYLEQRQNVEMKQMNSNQQQFNSDDAQLIITELERTWFPLCLEKMRDRNTTNTVSDNDNGIGLEFMLNIIQFSFVSCFVIVPMQFMAVYMDERFNVSVFNTQTQVTVGVVVFALVSFIVPGCMKNGNLLKKYLILFPLFIIAICVYMFAVTLTDYKHRWLYWIWWILLGGVMGALWYINESIVRELQPKRHTGKINGIKGISRYITGGIVSSLVAYYWNAEEEHAWFAYFQGIAYIIAGLINIFLIFYRLSSRIISL